MLPTSIQDTPNGNCLVMGWGQFKLTCQWDSLNKFLCYYHPLNQGPNIRFSSIYPSNLGPDFHLVLKSLGLNLSSGPNSSITIPIRSDHVAMGAVPFWDMLCIGTVANMWHLVSGSWGNQSFQGFQNLGQFGTVFDRIFDPKLRPNWPNPWNGRLALYGKLVYSWPRHMPKIQGAQRLFTFAPRFIVS